MSNSRRTSRQVSRHRDDINERRSSEQNGRSGLDPVQRNVIESSTNGIGHRQPHASSSSDAGATSSLSTPRSILKQTSASDVSPRTRRRRRRHVSFNSSDEIFIIPSRRQLREMRRLEARKRRLKRKLTMRQRRLSARNVRGRSRRRRRRREVAESRERVNKIARARRRYIRARTRSQSRAATTQSTERDRHNSRHRDYPTLSTAVRPDDTSRRRSSALKSPPLRAPSSAELLSGSSRRPRAIRSRSRRNSTDNT